MITNYSIAISVLESSRIKLSRLSKNLEILKNWSPQNFPAIWYLMHGLYSKHYFHFIAIEWYAYMYVLSEQLNNIMWNAKT